MLTSNQRVILKTYALTIPELVTAVDSGNDAFIRDYFNILTSLYGWKSFIPPEEYIEVIDWTEVDALTIGKARIWEWITSNQSMPLDLSKNNQRAGLANAFQGAQAMNTRNGLLGIASRLITLAESLLVLADSSVGTQLDAKTLTFEGYVSIQEASLIRIQVV